MDKAIFDKYEPIIGLEVHIQLLTKSKAYCSDSTEFGAMPNTQVSPISLGHPGTLPMVNKKVIEYAVKLGLACKCNITKENQYSRKNYFYPDLPKGYQITQQPTPICTGGFIAINTNGGRKNKKVELTRIHMEEDTGKSIHEQDPDYSLIDLNRAGVPLLEMVTEPVISNADEAYSYLTELRRLVRYLEICDGNMEEGSMRCDANVSVRLKGAEKFGTKVEVKNMNSISNVHAAIQFEIARQIEELERGGAIYQETRSFDASTGKTFTMRTKESADDYRYFPEPDLPPVMVTDLYKEEVRKTLPPLPDELYDKYTSTFLLSDYDASVIIDNKEFALYFEEITKLTKNYKAAANWINGDVKSYLNENAITIADFPLKPANIADIIALIDSGKVNYTIASQRIFPALLKEPTKTASEIAHENNLIQESDEGVLEEFIKMAMAKYPEKVTEYKNGKVSLVGLFMGEIMKLSKGKADPKKATQMLKEALDK